MSVLDNIFWFRSGKESVSVVKRKRKITILRFEDAKVISVYYNEVRIDNNGKIYNLDSGQFLRKVKKAHTTKGAKDEILLSAVLEVEDFSHNSMRGKVVKVSKLK